MRKAERKLWLGQKKTRWNEKSRRETMGAEEDKME